MTRIFLLLSLLLTLLSAANGFVVVSTSPSSRMMDHTTRLFAEKLPDIDKMKASEMRKELESYGISTKSLLEKSEFVKALKKVRSEGKEPETANASTSSSSKSGVNGDTSGGVSREPSRDERYQEAKEQAKGMKVGELKKELEGRGISTKSFFEKTEFVKAYAEFIADNPPPKKEPRDPDYRDVTMQKIDPRLLMGQSVIDVKARKK